ncbi:hypothetical protein HDU76_006832, partial [Blyttiomyces sp. JEL0837]
MTKSKNDYLDDDQNPSMLSNSSSSPEYAEFMAIQVDMISWAEMLPTEFDVEVLLSQMKKSSN